MTSAIRGNRTRAMLMILALLLFSATVDCANSEPSESTTSADSKGSIKSVGDVMAAGGRRLSADAVKSLVTGTTVQGRAAGSMNRFQSVFHADGSMKGELQTARGPIHLEGTWAVNDRGQLCTSFTKPRPSSGCAHVYSVNGTYFTALKDEASADVLERRFTK